MLAEHLAARGLALANSMLLSAWRDDWVPVPPDEDRYFDCLQERIRSAPGRAGSR